MTASTANPGVHRCGRPLQDRAGGRSRRHGGGYRAHDTRHDRPVAIKVLHPEIAAALGTTRFFQEIRLAARLNHPHIIALHDSDETDGTLYCVMPFIDGDNLRAKLDDRYPTVADLAVALEPKQKKGDGDAKPSIAVLPFSNMSTDPENEFFSDGIAEEIINALTKVQALEVVSRTSAFAFKGKNLDMREIGRQLGVKTLLEGSVRKAGKRLRVPGDGLARARRGPRMGSRRVASGRS